MGLLNYNQNLKTLDYSGRIAQERLKTKQTGGTD